MASYRYLRDIDPSELKPEPQRQLTPKEKRKNWWDYNGKWVLIGAIVAAVILFAVWDTVSAHGAAPDYQVAVVTPTGLDAEQQAALQAGLQAIAPDANGDGQTVVQVNVYVLAYGENTAASDASTPEEDMAGAVAGYNQLAGMTQLTADLELGNSGVFILADPENFSRATGALRYLDGSEPPLDDEGCGATDVENMVYAWGDCPALAALTESCPALADCYVGYRVAGSGSAALTEDQGLWQAVTAGAAG